MPRSAPEIAGGAVTARPRLAGATLVVSAVAGVAICVAVVRGEQILGARWGLLVRLALWAVAWGVGVAAALRMPRRLAIPAVFAVAVALRLAAVAGPPITSDDLYRYSWDGRVQLSGTDPYRYSPDAPQLTGLREKWLWPDVAGCAKLHRPEGCTRINRPTARTIYPPVAEAWFTAVFRVAGMGARHKAWQAAGLLGDVALVALLPRVLRAWKKDERWTALYALSPVPVLEVVNNGHIDGLAALLVVLALLAVVRRHPIWAGACLGAATAVKLYPALFVLGAVVAVWDRRQPGPLGARVAEAARIVAPAGAVIGLTYLPHVATVGLRVIGYLPGYLKEEKYGEGGRYLLAGILGLSADATAAMAVAGFLVVLAWLLWRRPSAPQACAALFGALLLAVTPVQPWYAVTLLAIATVAVRPTWAAVAVAGYPYFFALILDAPRVVDIGRLSYGLALVIVGLGALVARRTAHAHSTPSPDRSDPAVVPASAGDPPSGLLTADGPS